MAVAVGGPLDGTVLGVAEPERYEVRTADDCLHVYLRSERVVADGWAFDYGGRR